MYEFEIYNEETKEIRFTHGYNMEDMKRRNMSIDWSKWSVTYWEYID